MVTGKIIAVTAKLKPLLFNTSIDIARLSHTKEGDSAILVSTSLADCLIFGDPKSFGYHCPELLILIGQIDGTIEAIQPTGCRHSAVVHGASFLWGLVLHFY
jgi:hypothetical protein